ncbi:MAG TPA: aminotransferase class I/II-fold pyridoxal phosphate-dependent enzyme [Chloroflexota bacterium]|nr:aminotransferase class I/II-fold pyridoxal phosphate-dependent enzyme [Chloroflexota bacterium]
MNPAIAQLKPYAFAQLRSRQDALRAQGVKLINFGVGDPEDPTPEFIRQALVDAVTPSGRYPTAAGLPELRAAIAAWLTRRYRVAVDPERHVIPSNGAKEAIYTLAPLLLDNPASRRERQLIAIPELAYQVYGDSATMHHAETLPLPLDTDWLPDLNAITPAVGERLAILWLNFPNNPTGAMAPLAYDRDALALAERYGFYVASDEAYSELYYDEPPVGLLQAAGPDFRRAVVINTLSKRSNMTAYRSGLIAGDPELIAVMKNVRPRIGVATPEFIQKAAIAAWGDERHVEEQRARYAERRTLFMEVFAGKRLSVEASEAAFYLWVRVPEGSGDSFAFAERLMEAGVIVLPGGFMGPRGGGYFRLAFVPRIEVCREAAEILERVL